ncbi:MAG: hypothetical protein AAFS10_16780 [Myxococcota bacterium]
MLTFRRWSGHLIWKLDDVFGQGAAVWGNGAPHQTTHERSHFWVHDPPLYFGGVLTTQAH